MRRFLAAGGTALACNLFDGFRVKAIAVAGLLLILAAGSFSQTAFAQGSWVDSLTGKAVPSVPAGGAEADLTDRNRAFNPILGRNYHRDKDCTWRDSLTGKAVPTVPAGGAERDLTDPNRAFNPILGRNYYRDPGGKGDCPPPAAKVTDVTLTGLPPNTTVSLTNEETKEKVEQKTDDRGFVVIPMTGKNWQSGRHSVTCQVDGKPVTSKIFLREGVNRVDLTSLTYSARPLDPANAQKVDEALKKSSAALKADPKNSQALLTQGSALNRLGRHGEALAQLARAAKMGSTHPALAFETGWSLMRLGMYPEAIAQLEKYEKMNPGLGQTSEFIGRSHLFMGELDKADAKFKEALQRDPKLASTVRFHQAVLETLRKNPQAAATYIGALLKEAPNSPTAQIFKNALLQAPGAKPPAGAGAKDFKLSDPIRIQLPPTTAGDVAGAVAKGVVGGLLGGLFGGGRREPEGPKLAAKPALPETTLTSKDGKTKINLSGAIEDGKPYVIMGVKESPGNGAPHLILLQDKNCNVMQPKETSVTGIWEAWGGWKMTVSWTKSYYQDGQLVSQEKGGWSTPWNLFRTQIKDLSEIPGIWKDFGGKPFEGIREVMSSFEPPPEIPFNPADWNLITHTTTDAGNNQILTAPFVTGLGTDQKNNLIFKPMDRTVCESDPPSAPLLSNNLITFPWNVGPYAVTMTQDPERTRNDYEADFRGIEFTVKKRFAEHFDFGPSSGLFGGAIIASPPPDTTVKIETRAGGSTIVTQPDGTTVETWPDGNTFKKLPDGTEVRTYPGGYTFTLSPDGTDTRISPGGTVVNLPDGSSVETRSDGTRYEERPDGTTVHTYPNGYGIVRWPDGSSVEGAPDGRVRFNDPPAAAEPGFDPVPPPPPGITDIEDGNNAPRQEIG